ncbi:MAG: hypothetical protein LC745_06465, partial [Planctomycetia bacterium]|nr:hypothetical protein [Planctomycetia bacterium]
MDQAEDAGVSPPGTPFARRLPRLMPPPAGRRLTPGRVLLAALGACSALALVALAVSHVRDGARRYVDDQGVYLLSGMDIVLDPPPPPWYRGGSLAFLEHALGGDSEFQTFSALDFDPERLALRFRLYAWVDKVLRVEVGHPNRVVVRLAYRDPVAVERLNDATDRTVVDREGVILPRKDIDFDRVGPLVKLFGFGAPADPHDGKVWDRVVPKHGLAVRDERVRGAARLAAFFRNELRREAGQEPAFQFVAIHPWGDDGFSVQVGA